MGSHSFAGLLVGLVAIAAGGFAIYTAIFTRRNRAETASTYASMGGPVFSVIQFGCGGALALGGLVVIALVLLGGHRP